MTTTTNGATTGAETTTRSRRSRATRAATMIEELTQQRVALPRMGPGASASERRDGRLRRALIAARLAGWWRVLARTTAWGEVPEVFVTAAYSARYAERDKARKALDSARFWADRAQAQPRMDVSGSDR
jgi:hypothetical protein